MVYKWTVSVRRRGWWESSCVVLCCQLCFEPQQATPLKSCFSITIQYTKISEFLIKLGKFDFEIMLSSKFFAEELKYLRSCICTIWHKPIQYDWRAILSVFALKMQIRLKRCAKEIKWWPSVFFQVHTWQYSKFIYSSQSTFHAYIHIKSIV